MNANKHKDANYTRNVQLQGDHFFTLKGSIGSQALLSFRSVQLLSSGNTEANGIEGV